MESNVVISRPDAAPLESAFNRIVQEVDGFKVTSKADLELASDKLNKIKTLKNEILTTFDAPIKQAYKAHKAIISARDRYLKPLSKYEKSIKVAISNFVVQQEREAKEKQRKIMEEAKRKAALEFKKKAEAALDEGDLERAVALDEAAKAPEGLVVTPEIPVTKPKVEGLVTREVWKFEIVDASLLPREYLMPDQKKIGKVVTALKGSAKIPGVRVWKEVVPYTR